MVGFDDNVNLRFECVPDAVVSARAFQGKTFDRRARLLLAHKLLCDRLRGTDQGAETEDEEGFLHKQSMKLMAEFVNAGGIVAQITNPCHYPHPLRNHIRISMLCRRHKLSRELQGMWNRRWSASGSPKKLLRRFGNDTDYKSALRSQEPS